MIGIKMMLAGWTGTCKTSKTCFAVCILHAMAIVSTACPVRSYDINICMSMILPLRHCGIAVSCIKWDQKVICIKWDQKVICAALAG